MGTFQILAEILFSSSVSSIHQKSWLQQWPSPSYTPNMNHLAGCLLFCVCLAQNIGTKKEGMTRKTWARWGSLMDMSHQRQVRGLLSQDVNFWKRSWVLFPVDCGDPGFCPLHGSGPLPHLPPHSSQWHHIPSLQFHVLFNSTWHIAVFYRFIFVINDISSLIRLNIPMVKNSV